MHVAHLVVRCFVHVEPKHSLGNVLSVGKIGVPLVRLTSSDIPVTQEIVLAHCAAVNHGGYDKSCVERKKA